MIYLGLLGLLKRAKSDRVAEACFSSNGLSYAREFGKALETFVDDSRKYLKDKTSKKPKPFETLVVDGSQLDSRLFEGLSPIGRAPWYFVGEVDNIVAVEAKLRENADKLGLPVKYGRGQLRCMRRTSIGYESCSLDDYVSARVPGNDFRLSALPQSSAYMTYYPHKTVKLEGLTDEAVLKAA